jgi:predicted SAM-dependent methyltransferase
MSLGKRLPPADYALPGSASAEDLNFSSASFGLTFAFGILIPTQGRTEVMKLHIGGKQVKEGWKILNIQPGPGVDYLGDISDLSQFADRSIDEIYASHVLEHVPSRDIPQAVSGIFRVLKRGGRALISVPDMDILCTAFISSNLSFEQKSNIVGMMFGGQVDAYDFHHFGWNFAFMRHYFSEAGFLVIERVESLGEFADTSEYRPFGFPISLNVIITK